MNRLLIVLPMAVVLFAQNAQMVLLDRRDTDELKAKYAEYKAAQKQWEDTKSKVAAKYKDIDWGATEFSKDFRIAIPYRNYSLNTWTNPHMNTLAGSNSTTSLATGSLSDYRVTTDQDRLDMVTTHKP